jgi:general secretion pathway protein G
VNRRYGSAAAIAILIVAIGLTLTQRHKVVDARPERTLRDDLKVMRKAITDYRAKHQHNPGSLRDLVTDGELRAIPIDPITHSQTTWKTTVEESVRVDDFQPGSAKSAPSITDVRSGATGNDSAGRPFSDY